MARISTQRDAGLNTRINSRVNHGSGAARVAAGLLVLAGGGFGAMAHADVVTTVTTDPAALSAALQPRGLTITSIVVKNGQPGQIGTYSNFNAGQVTIRNGIVLSSGSVASMGPLAEVLDPAYDPAGPPAAVNSAMDPNGAGGTPEFDAFGQHSNNIANFTASFDVASIEVHFTLAEDSQVQFDFIFGSVEFPVYTSSYTDAFLVFLDGTSPNDQVTFDAAGDAVQVGQSFAGLETTADVNTAFASPHALIHHLTTTTARLDAGAHTLRFEVGDVNDPILDSAAFITGLRTGTGTVGTDPSDDCRADFNASGSVSVQDILDFVTAWLDNESDANFNGVNGVTVQDLLDFFTAWLTGC